ncbi:DUF6911 family protein [Achromobacter spanius]|uniref:DUF6911 family protein n=1 Tax=Achromobacter spanius TaxID=217203 RepID=UPI003D65D691
MSGYEGPGTVLKLYALDGSRTPPAEVTERPVWERVLCALRAAYENGGLVVLEVVLPKASSIIELRMKAIPGHYKLFVRAQASDPLDEFLEWWEPGDSIFRGNICFGDDEWDARTVCADLRIAENMFHELFESGSLRLDLQSMRSLQYWRP